MDIFNAEGTEFFAEREEKRREEKSIASMESSQLNVITGRVIGAAIEVHRKLGPGLLESAYQSCLEREFILSGIPFEKQKPLPVEYKGVRLECGYRLDFLVAGNVVVEIKALDTIAPIHEAQLVTYLSIGGWNVGLLINFNVLKLTDGVRRRVLGFND